MGRFQTRLARLPHEYSTWLGPGHTVPNGDPPAPFDATTKLCGTLLLSALSLRPETQRVPVGDQVVDIWTLWPLHADEMEHKLAHGTDALLDQFERAQVSDVVDPARPSAIPPPRKKRFGIF